MVTTSIIPDGTHPAAAADSACATSQPAIGSYSVKVCLPFPDNSEAQSGVTLVSAAVTVEGNNPGIQRVIFYLDGAYLLTDYQTPYLFKLPTTRWVDGSHRLEVRAQLRDGFLTGRARNTVEFQNGLSMLPVNMKTFTPKTGLPAADGQPFVVMATGDGAAGEINTSKVVNLIAAEKPNLMLYLGDVYEKGTPTEFFNWYGDQGAYFNRFIDITDPTIGNHEYSASGNANGYFDYWDNAPEYYSFNAGGWHFVSLNSNSRKSPIHGDSEQYAWLEQDLAANSGSCTIVFYHHPYLNVGSEGPRPTLDELWRLMAQYGVSIVLNGHDHNYQRWVALDSNAAPNPRGITEFVVGGGGHGVQTLVRSDDRVAVANSNSPDILGALKLSLTGKEARFEFKSITGVAIDSGTITCNK